MEMADFKESAQLIAQRNVNERVRRVLADFDPPTGHLRVVYCTASEPTEDDWEDCELTCGELLAAFPEIKTAETKCMPAEDCDLSGDDESVVFSQN